jgi:peptidoglycan glycosyltransferase
MASSPYFNPANLDSGGALGEGVMLNRAAQGLYTPGSVFKLVTSGAVLESGLATPDTIYEDGDATEHFDGFAVSCGNNPPGTRSFDLRMAFAYSCNLTFARLGDSLGEDRLRAHSQRFGIGQAPPFPLPVASGGLSANRPMSRPELVSTAFGQGETLVTPLQMALIVAATAGDGSLPVPWLLADVPGERWSSLADERGTWRRAISRSSAAQLRDMMLAAALEGSARPAVEAAGMELGGKTGTAQLAEGQVPHSWFVGFAPASTPRVAVAVLVENGGEGHLVAAPIGGRVLSRALDAIGAKTP